MKRISLYIITALLLPVALLAQISSEPYEMMVNGVKVIVKPSGNELVVIQTLVKGGVQNYPAGKAGIESIAMTALTECGTDTDNKNSFKDKLDKVTAQVYGYTSMDYASFNLNCIKADLGEVWPLYTAALLTPKFEPKEFDRIKQDAVNGIRANESSPDAAIDKLSKETAFAGKNYAKDPNGTVAIIEGLKASEVKKYWQSVFNKNRIVIVVVGDVEKEKIREMVSALTAKLPAGPGFIAKKEKYLPAATTFKPVARENATNYVQGVAGAPLPGSPDYNAYNLAMRIFSNRHFIEIRTKNGLSYAPGAWFSPGNTPYANLYVTTTDPDKYIAVARALIDKVKTEGFTESELKNEKTGYLTGIHYRNETNEAQAASLAANEVIYGDWKRSFRLNDEIKKVTLEQINAAFKRYMTNITWVYQGDVKKVTPVLFTQKETPPIPVEKKAF
ncbi:MAG: insulinase family protein [Chitinophagaceae bacterium]|nr:MAG: insulinase family protein [Chitinophagaceae bacterium]